MNDNNLVHRNGKVEGINYEYDYDNNNKVIIINVKSDILSYTHYKRLVGKVFDIAKNEFKDYV